MFTRRLVPLIRGTEKDPSELHVSGWPCSRYTVTVGGTDDFHYPQPSMITVDLRAAGLILLKLTSSIPIIYTNYIRRLLTVISFYLLLGYSEFRLTFH